MTLFLCRMDQIRPLQKWSTEEKNRYSHRKKATEKLITFLKNLELNKEIERTTQPKYNGKRLNSGMHQWRKADAGRIVSPFCP